MNRIAALSITALMAATPALADGPAPAPVTPVVIAPASSDWTGAYLGLSIGTGNGEATQRGVSEESDMTTYGLFGGYNYDMGNMIAGVELSYDRLEIKDVDTDKSNVLRLMGRFGYDAGQVFPYVTAGFAKADLGDRSDSGYAVGVGADFRVTDNFVVGAQYLHHSFDDFDDTGIDFKANLFQIRAAYKF